jgi:hypothetical protein
MSFSGGFLDLVLKRIRLMVHKVLAILLVFVLMGLFADGCGDKEPTQEKVGTMEQYHQEAAESIDENNAEQELKDITKEIEADATSE